MAGLKTRDLVYSSLGVTLLIISSYIYVPLPFTPVPGTLQTLVVILVALSFKPKISRMAIAVFLFLGSIGFPVFSGGRGGAGAILGPTGGFIMGFAVAVFLISAFRSRINSFMKAVVYSVLFGNVPIFLFGASYLAISRNLTLTQAAAAGVLPFILPDLFKTVAAAVIWSRLVKTGLLENKQQQ